MKIRSKQFRQYGIITGILVLLIVVAGGYFYSSFSRSYEYYIQRDFRQIRDIGRQLEERLNNFHTVIDKSARSVTIEVDSLLQDEKLDQTWRNLCDRFAPIDTGYLNPDLHTMFAKRSEKVNTITFISAIASASSAITRYRQYLKDYKNDRNVVRHAVDAKTQVMRKRLSYTLDAQASERRSSARSAAGLARDFDYVQQRLDSLRTLSARSLEEEIRNAFRAVPHLHFNRAFIQLDAKIDDAGDREIRSDASRTSWIVNNDELSPGLQYSLPNAEGELRINATASFGDILEPLFTNDVFDKICLARDSSGAVIFQAGSTGGVITSLDIVSNIGLDSGARISDFAGSTKLTDYRFAGSDYKIFIQPIQLDHHIERNGKRVTWALCGMVSDYTLGVQSRTISYNLLLLFVVLLVLLGLGWSLINAWGMGRRESLSTTDALFLTLSALLGSAMLTVLVLDIYVLYSMHRQRDDVLQRFGEDVAENVLAELKRASRQLDFFSRGVAPRLAEMRNNNKEMDTVFITGRRPAPDADTTFDFTYTVELPKGANLLRYAVDTGERHDAPASDQLQDAGWDYPYFDRLFWIDERGTLIAKINAEPFKTLLINVQNRNYFLAAKNNRLWKLPGKRASAQECYLSPHYSWTTGDYESTLAISVPRTTADANSLPVAAAMDINRFISVTDPALPPGFGFCIINSGGQVLYHSIKNRNWFENFFQECDNDRRLQSAVTGRRSDHMEVRYWGEDHRLYTMPLQSTPWTVVVFAEKEYLRTLNLETLTIAAFSFLCNALLVFLLFVFGYFKRGWNALWVWPDPAVADQYRILFIGNCLSSALFLIGALWFYTHDQLHLMGLLFPAYSVLHTYQFIKKESDYKGALKWLVRIGIPTLSIVFIAVSVLECRSSDAGVFRNIGNLCINIGLVLAPILIYRYRAAFERLLRLDQTSHTLIFRILGIQRLCTYDYKRLYNRVAWTLLIIASVLPTIAFFKAAYASQFELYVKHAQLELFKEIEKRNANIDRQYRNILITDKNEFLRERKKLDWDIYSRFFYDAQRVYADTASNENWRLMDGSIFYRDIQQHLPFVNDIEIGFRSVASSAAADAKWRWEKNADGDIRLQAPSQEDAAQYWLTTEVQLPFAPFGFQTKWFDWLFLFVVIVVSGFFLWFVYVLMRFFSRSVFLIDLDEPPARGRNVPDFSHLDRPTLLIAPPLIKNEEILPAGVATHEHDCANLIHDAEKLRALTAEDGHIVVLSNFEYRIADPVWNRRKIETLRMLLQKGIVKLLVISAVDPTLIFPMDNVLSTSEDGSQKSKSKNDKKSDEEGQESADPAAATHSPIRKDIPAIFAKLRKRTLGPPSVDERAKFISSLSDGAKPIASGCADAQQTLITECMGDRRLQEIGLDIADRSDIGELNDIQIKRLVGDHARPYYTAIWQSSSEEEKLALVDLAKDGIVNSKNLQAVESLMQRGLVRKLPNLQLVNQSFRWFVQQEELQAEAQMYEEQGEKTVWSLLRIPVIVIVIGAIFFLFTTQRDLLDTTTTLVSAILVLLPAMIKILGLFRVNKGNAGGS